MYLKYALIYNPYAGLKRKILPNPNATSLEDIKSLLERYQIPVDLFPTKYPGHATTLAKEVAQNYHIILVAGGDGTVGEVVNGLANSNVTLGILPLGSFMNVAKMLSIPPDIEKAIMLIKIGRVRKIDLGVVTNLSGEKLAKPYFFLESSGIGLEAQLHENFTNLEKGHLSAIIQILRSFFDYYGHLATLEIDDQKLTTRATIINVSNGPYSGTALPIAPKAKLNDHRLTITLFKMSKFEIINYFLKLTRTGRRIGYQKIESHTAKKVKIITKVKRLVHADARLYGETPVEFKIAPNALNIITGFPDPSSSALIKRTLLDP